MTRRLRLMIVLLALPGALLLASCGHPVVGGLLGGLSLLGVILAGLLSAATLPACDTGVNACLSPIRRDGGSDGEMRACLSIDARPFDGEMRACLQPPPREGGLDVCLTVDAPRPDAEMGPCLKIMPPDGSIGPCLSPPINGDQGASLTPDPESRQQTIARLEQEGALPAEIAERLRKLG